MKLLLGNGADADAVSQPTGAYTAGIYIEKQLPPLKISKFNAMDLVELMYKTYDKHNVFSQKTEFMKIARYFGLSDKEFHNCCVCLVDVSQVVQLSCSHSLC